jgi:hypothetical protein
VSYLVVVLAETLAGMAGTIPLNNSGFHYGHQQERS